MGVFENKERGHKTRVFVLYVGSPQTVEVWEEPCRARRWFRIDTAIISIIIIIWNTTTTMSRVN